MARVLAWTVTAFDDLGVGALYEILTLRQVVFTVEQDCAYLDCDGKDRASLHLTGHDAGGRLAAYARLLPAGTSFAEPSIGRVVTHPDVRRTGLGRALMREAILQTRAAFGPQALRIGAQLYLRRFYESFGFTVASDVYDEDGIPHIEMHLPPP